MELANTSVRAAHYGLLQMPPQQAASAFTASCITRRPLGRQGHLLFLEKTENDLKNSTHYTKFCPSVRFHGYSQQKGLRPSVVCNDFAIFFVFFVQNRPQDFELRSQHERTPEATGLFLCLCARAYIYAANARTRNERLARYKITFFRQGHMKDGC